MDARLNGVNRVVKSFDRYLYATRTESGMIQVYRKGIRWDYFTISGQNLTISRLNPLYVLSLTDNWSVTGCPVEWGLEPVRDRLQEIDSWNRDIMGELDEQEEKNERLQKRSMRNEFRARALDMRRDFAKATDHINTSTLAKIDNRKAKGA